jgi:hypothetical protein
MSLYLGIFDGDEEINGWVFGHYSDFGCFRDAVASVVDARRFPVLMQSSDCDSEWSPDQQRLLIQELAEIGEVFRLQPPKQPEGSFEHTGEFRRGAASLYDCFHNVDGENVFEAMTLLCEVGIEKNLPLVMQ